MSIVNAVISWIMGSEIAMAAIAALIGFLGFKVNGIWQKRKGKAEARRKAVDADAENARAIQRRVRDAERLPARDKDTRGYRD